MNLFFSILLFALTLWLGLYLIQRREADRRLGWTGAGLLTYALGIALLTISTYHTPDPAAGLSIQFWWLLSLPSLFWTGAAVHLLPPTQRVRPHLERFWQYGQLPLVALLAPLFFAGSGTTSAPIWLLYTLLALTVLLPLSLIVLLLLHSALTTRPRRLSALLIVAILLFTLSMAALFLPILPLSSHWMILSMGLDLVLLGFAIGKLDAFEQGERFVPDLLLSLSIHLLSSLLLGGLILATMLLATGVTPAMLALLFATISVAIGLQSFAPSIQRTIDRLVLARFPLVIEERAELQALVDALPRHPPPDQRPDAAAPIAADDEEEFTRLIRRALSQLNDLNKLATNPLIQLPLVSQRAAAQTATDSTLDRAQALRALLIEAICQLKPAEEAEFGTSNAWRYYNALYFPYVVGLKPYSRRATADSLASGAQQALEWFRSQVPERTLYNWQNTAAALVAQSIREQTAPRSPLERSVEPTLSAE